MALNRTLVVTTINAPNAILRALNEGAAANGWRFIVVGDTKTPPAFTLAPAQYLDVAAQVREYAAFCELLPTRHYARKNVGYLLAARLGADEMVETDDDNMPRAEFFSVDSADQMRPWVSSSARWHNVYGHFSETDVWPRGYPLELLHTKGTLTTRRAVSRRLIIQGLADGNPDVDAVFRMTRPLPLDFHRAESVVVAPGTWCPFNSQNTIFKREVFPLLYLPSYCSFRMTDIWRSFVAQRIIWERAEGVEFTSATVFQERNAHELIRDFQDEVPGYLNNARICARLESVRLDGADLNRSLVLCYEQLVALKLIDEKELPLLRRWIAHFE